MTTRRREKGPEQFLRNYCGYLQADAYVAYDSFFTNPARGMVEAGCMAHARRHVYQARDTDPARMGAVLAYIAQLYAVEKRARWCSIEGEQVRLLREHYDQCFNSCTLIYCRSRNGIAVGRHNWVFLGSDRGGKTMAVLRSFVASCERAKVDPFE
jgi:hypothetical protein